MTDIKLKTQSGDSVIHCGEGAFSAYAHGLAARGVFIVTDANVFSLYRDLIRKTFGEKAPVKILPAGETSKSTRYLLEIIQAMLEADMKRDCTVIAIGGGVVGDIAGLAASLYMRGVNLVQIPTTLLSQVDSSVGGKTAVDFKNVKNLIGTFYQPGEVIADPLFLETLPPREIRCGLGEIIKYGALNGEIYSKLKNADDFTNPHFLADIITDCIRHKAEVVARDEHDLNGIRKTLNLGHTTGHALELYYGRKSHGEFVLIGMYYELYIAHSYGVCKGSYYENLISLITRVLKKIPVYEDMEKALTNAVHDKKNPDGKISVIVPGIEGKSAEILLDFNEYVSLITECGNVLKEAYGKS